MFSPTCRGTAEAGYAWIETRWLQHMGVRPEFFKTPIRRKSVTEDQLRTIVRYAIGRAGDIADSMAHHPIGIAQAIRDGVDRVVEQVLADCKEVGLFTPPMLVLTDDVDVLNEFANDTGPTVHDAARESEAAAALLDGSKPRRSRRKPAPVEPDPALGEGAITEAQLRAEDEALEESKQ